MDGARQDGGGVLVWLGITGLLVGLLLIGASFLAGRDAQDPRCDGKEMRSGDVCLSPTGAQGYDDRSSFAETASIWLLRIGGVLVVGGVGALAASGPSRTRRY